MTRTKTIETHPDRARDLAERLLDLARRLAHTQQQTDLASFLERHGVRGYLENFPDLWNDVVGQNKKARQRADFQVQKVAFSLKVASYQDWLGNLLGTHGIRFLSLKGISLSYLLYGNISEREFGDLDLLIASNDSIKAFRLLEEHGLVRTYPRNYSPGQDSALIRYGKAQNFINPTTSLSLDLHWKLLSNWIGDDLLPFGSLWEKSQTIEREGVSPWRTLGNPDTLIFLALHGFQDGWNRLKQLLDLGVAVQTLDCDWDEVLSRAGPRAVLVEMAVELVQRLLGVRHGGLSTAHYANDESAFLEWLALSTSPRTPQRWLLQKHLWSCPWPEAVRRSLKGLFTPSLEDIESVKLSEHLISAYPLIRVWRLLGKALAAAKSPKPWGRAALCTKRPQREGIARPVDKPLS